MRSRYVWDKRTQQLVEVPTDHKAPSKEGPFVMPDLDRAYGGAIVSPIDGEHITSRSHLRAHERKHGVRQCGDFKPGEIVQRDRNRADALKRAAEGGSFSWIDYKP